MTYPPQQPYGGQDPYGQGQPQQPGQYGGGQQYGGPQYGGGYQQQQPAGQYGAYDQTAQYGGFPGGQYGGGYGGPPPPQKSKTGAIVAIVTIVVLVLGGLGITGFVAPGFFLSDDKKDDAGGGGDTKTSEPKEGGGAAAEFIDKLVAATDDKDKDALNEMACSDAESNVKSAIEDIDEISGAELTGTEEVSDDEVKVSIDITVDDSAIPFEGVVVKDGEDWCWQDITPSGGSMPTGGSEPTDDGPASGPTGGSGDSGGGNSGDGGGGGDTGADNGEAFVDDFLNAINSGDAAKATAVLCKDNDSESDITDAIAAKADLKVDPAETQYQDEYAGVELTGTIDGAPVSSARTSAFYRENENGWCILTFYAF